MIVLAIVLGAAVGAPLRFLVDRWVMSRTASTSALGEVPWGLFVVNLLGTVAAALAVSLASGLLRTFLLVGFAGAFTTFSGFAWDAHRLWTSRRSAFWVTVIAMPMACTAAFVGVTKWLS